MLRIRPGFGIYTKYAFNASEELRRARRQITLGGESRRPRASMLRLPMSEPGLGGALFEPCLCYFWGLMRILHTAEDSTLVWAEGT